MKNTSTILGLGAAVVTMALYSACSSGSGTPANTGGGTGLATGGSTSVANTSAGGSTSASTDTSVSTGGASTATGGGTATPPIVVNSFDTSAQVGTFTASTYVPTDCGVNIGVPNNDAGASLLVEWSGTVDTNADAPTKGSMKVTATFTGWSQYWELDMNAPTDANGNPIDLTGKQVTAQIKIVSGLSPDSNFPDGADLFVKTGADSVWGAAGWTNVDQTSTFVTLKLDSASPQGVPSGSTWDAKSPKSLGIKLSTGSGQSTYCGSSAEAFGPPVTTIAYVDDILISDRP